MALAPLARQRRFSELALGVLVAVIAVGGYVLVALADGPTLPPGVVALLVWVGGLYLVAHFAIRRFAPNADATLLPIAALLNGIGFVMIARLDQAEDPPTHLASVQSVWVAVGIAVFVLTLFFVRDVRVFERYRYTILLIGLVALLLPLAPSVGRTINGARLWVAFGSLTFEPSELAKVLLVAFFAAYLVDKREVLTQGRVRFGRFSAPSLRDLGPLFLAWGVALLVLAYEKDVGTSLLFFGVFAAMLYMATRRGAYVVGALILLAFGAWLAYHSFGHVRVRVDTWLDPWKTRQTTGYQIAQAQYAFGSGGVAGTGLGRGSPTLVPNASTDFIFAAIGEELGLAGTLGVLSAFILLVGSAYRIAVDAVRPFSKLFAAGIATILGFQTFLIIGGVTRVIPLTGITLPFVSYGGSSLVANFALLAILLRISDDTARHAGGTRSGTGHPDGTMNGGIRRVGTVILVLFVGLVAQLTYLQLVDSNKLADDPHNTRRFLQDLRRPRGPIVSADGAVLAKSVPSNDPLKYQRVYPTPTAKLFAQVVGYQSIQFGSVGVEAQYSSALAGRGNLSIHNLGQLANPRPATGTVVLNLSVKAQAAAAAGLAGRRGSVVVLNVRTGGIVAAYSNPTFNPQLLASHNEQIATIARQFLLAAPDNPMLPRVWREVYPPGSTFKTVSASTALQDNVDVNKHFPFITELELPLTTATLQNFGGERCGGSLEEGFIESCNTTFGQVGLDLNELLATGVQRFGVNTDPPPSDLSPSIVPSIGPRKGTFKIEQPRFAQAAIGQGPVSVTPLQMALVAESVATGGVILEPHVANRIEDSDGNVLRRFGKKEWRRAMDPATAATLRRWMIEVVQRGTGTAAQIPGIQVAGKTGTAENAPDQRPHTWFIAFAPADDPLYAIAVLVEHGGSSEAETTGGRVAAPVAADVLRALLGA